MSLGARIGWESARLLAACGAFYLLPTEEESQLACAVRPLVGSNDSLAIMHARGSRRGLVLVVTANARIDSVIKVALDPDGRRKLARETAYLTEARRLLEPPVSAPRVLESQEGILVLEPVEWLPRWRPWELSLELARGIGRLHALGGPSGHFAHGDFAPWNVMRTSQGWVVLDWEEASATSRPYVDPFHYITQAHALLGRPGAREILRGLQGRGTIGAALETYASAAGLTDVDQHEAFVAYLRGSMPDDLSRPKEVRGFRARRRLLEMLTREPSG